MDADSWASRIPPGICNYMNRLKPGFIGFIPKEADYYETIAKYASFGYQAVEHGGAAFRPGVNVAEHIAKLKALGLRHLTLDASVQNGNYPNVAELVSKCRAIEVDSVNVFHTSATAWRFADRPEHPDEEEIMAELDRMNRLSTELAAEGIDLVFHNHDQEYLSTVNGVPLFWQMASMCPKLRFELDLAWIHYAGWNPAQLIRQLGSRVKVLHVKDYTRGENYEYKPARTITVPRYTTPGTGLVDLQECFQAAVDVGVKWAVIEQDMQYNLNHEESVKTAYMIMKETGFVE